MFNVQSPLMNLSRSPRLLTTHDMWIPTCATCHMSGINGNKVTHDPSERLSYYLADAITKKRPNYLYAQNNMKQICSQCHTKPIIDRVYQQAEQVVKTTNERVAEAKAIVDGLRGDRVLKGPAFTNRIDFVYFDLWHYDGRTSKHGAFMGGADFVQWHGNYPMLSKLVELKSMAQDLRGGHGHGK
jgi:hydroxylamine dehydrogenase